MYASKLWDIFKSYFKLYFSYLLGSLAGVILQITDSSMIGSLGHVQLAASILVSNIYWFPFVFIIGLNAGIMPLITLLETKKKLVESSNLLISTYILNISIASIFVILLNAIILRILEYTSQDPIVLSASRQYYKIICFSLIPDCIFRTSSMYLRALKITSIPSILIVVCIVLNILLNYCLIYGNFIFPELGLTGAGWATLISKVISSILILIYLLRRSSFINNLKLSLLSIRNMSESFSWGWPSGVQYISETSSFIIITLMSGWLGSIYQASHAILTNIAMMGFISFAGVGESCSILTAEGIGRGDKGWIRDTVYIGSIIGFCIISIISITVYWFNMNIVSLFTTNTTIIPITKSIIFTIILRWVFQFCTVLSSGLMRSFGLSAIIMKISIFCHLVIGVIASYIFAFSDKQGLIGLWRGDMLGSIILIIILSIFVYKNRMLFIYRR